MLLIIIYSLIMFLTLLAIFDIIRLCTIKHDESNNYLGIWSAPYGVMKNTLKGMRTLKEEKELPQAVKPEVKPYSISETV